MLLALHVFFELALAYGRPSKGRGWHHGAVRFHVEHGFSAPPEAVLAILLDPDFHRGLELPDVRLDDVVDHRAEGDESVLAVRYEFVGKLNPIVKRLLGGRRLTWRQELRVHRTDGTGRLTFHAEADPKGMHGDAAFSLRPDGEGSRRVLDGDLRVSVPFVGGAAERRIVDGLVRRLDLEARAVEARLQT